MSRLPRYTRLSRGGAIKPKKRSHDEFLRVYGGADRVEWLRSQPSVVSGRTPCVVAHVGNGGLSRKADASSTVPLTVAEHEELHRIGQRSFEAKYRLSLADHAALTEIVWQSIVRGAA